MCSQPYTCKHQAASCSSCQDLASPLPLSPFPTPPSHPLLSSTSPALPPPPSLPPLSSLPGRLRAAGYKLRFCTNETQITRKMLATRLRSFGFQLEVEEIHSPAPACRSYLTRNGLRPHLLGQVMYGLSPSIKVY